MLDYFLIYLGSASVIINIVSTLMIYDYLRKKGEKVSFFWLRFLILNYADRYKKITKEETGKTGYLFYFWIISINFALICFVTFIIQQWGR